jgi:hypothetical protein
VGNDSSHIKVLWKAGSELEMILLKKNCLRWSSFKEHKILMWGKRFANNNRSSLS